MLPFSLIFDSTVFYEVIVKIVRRTHADQEPKVSDHFQVFGGVQKFISSLRDHY